MKFCHFSKSSTILDTTINDPIHLFTQFFIHRDSTRNKELKFCIKSNIENPNIHKVHLLGERIYTDKELGIENSSFSNKIIQTVIGHRLRFQDVIAYIRTNQIQGYHVWINSDICFHPTALANLRKSNLHLERKMMALLRFEYNPSNPENSPMFGPRFDSQDTWIFHSKFPIPEHAEKSFNFEFGKPGCDNKLIYLLSVLGYEIVNDPLFVKTWHVHSSQSRDYTIKDSVPNPWGVVVPANANPLLIPPSLGINLRDIAKTTRNFIDLKFEDNTTIYNYVLDKMQSNTPFVFPRISGIENNFAVFGRMIKEQGPNQQLLQYIQQVTPAMKNNAGIKMSSMESVIKYSDHYLRAFDYCEMIAGWDVQGNYIGHISHSHEYIKQKYPTRKMVWALSLDIFHYIYSTPWTHALRGKRVLIVSPFEKSIQEKLPIRSKIYGVDLFPECEIITICPPQTHASQDSNEFDIELENFKHRLDIIKDKYDIALLSCGGYANPVAAYLFECGKSAVYVGGVLQMYFGILGGRWLKERPDIVRMYLNEHWSRPKESERPKNCNNIEGGCYW